MIAYLDTNALIWLAQGSLDGISPKADKLLKQADLLFSPMAMLELEYLYEIKRIKRTARDIQEKVEHELARGYANFRFRPLQARPLTKSGRATLSTA